MTEPPSFQSNPFELPGDLLIQNLDFGKKRGIVRAKFQATGNQPIRKSAVANFAMIPRPNAHDEWQPNVFAGLGERVEIALAGPVPLVLDFLVVNPEDVGGDDGDSACLHFEEFVAPFGLRIARVVEFAHHREPGFAVAKKRGVIERERVAIGIARGAHVEAGGFEGGRWSGGVDEERFGGERDRRCCHENNPKRAEQKSTR